MVLVALAAAARNPAARRIGRFVRKGMVSIILARASRVVLAAWSAMGDIALVRLVVPLRHGSAVLLVALMMGILADIALPPLLGEVPLLRVMLARGEIAGLLGR